MKKERKKTAIIHLGRVKKNYIYFYKQLNGNYAKRGEKKKRHERAQNKLPSAAINPRYRSNDTLSNYTSGKAVTVSWYQLRIISRSVYQRSIRGTNRKGAAGVQIVAISFHANRESMFHHTFL